MKMTFDTNCYVKLPLVREHSVTKEKYICHSYVSKHAISIVSKHETLENHCTAVGGGYQLVINMPIGKVIELLSRPGTMEEIEDWEEE